MRHHQPQPEQMTRLLLQKPKEYAELDENSRIALTVLQEDGWVLERIGHEIEVTVTRTPIERPGIAAQLADCEARYAELRSEVMSLHQRNVDLEALRVAMRAEIVKVRRHHWRAAAAGCFACSILAWLQLPLLIGPLGAACTVAWWFQGYRLAKGAA